MYGGSFGVPWYSATGNGVLSRGEHEARRRCGGDGGAAVGSEALGGVGGVGGGSGKGYRPAGLRGEDSEDVEELMSLDEFLQTT